MIKDKKTGMEMPESEFERMWYTLKYNLEQETQKIEEEIKPKNRKRDLEKKKNQLKINKELIETCKKHLKGGERK